jgi:hypothetical protein
MTPLNTKKTMLVAVATIALSALLIVLSGKTQTKFISLSLLTVCVVVAPVLFLLLFYLKLLPKLFLSFLALVYAFYLLELFSRILIPYKTDFDRNISSNARKPYPYIQFKGDSAFNQKINYPQKESMPQKGDSEYRIFLLGGSTVTGGSPPVTAIIQTNFAKAGYSDVHVYNMGVISSNANMEMARVVYEVIDYKPDLILFYNGGNDIMMPFNHDPRPGYPYNFCAYEGNVFYDTDNYPALALIAYKSNLLKVLFRNYFTNAFGKKDKLREQVSYRTELWENKIANEYVSAISKTDKIAKAFGAEFMVFLQPTVYYKNKCSANENSYKRTDKPEYKFNNSVRQKILEKINTAGLTHFTDLTTIYQNDTTEYFIDVIHTNQHGIQIVADRMFADILNSINIPKPGTPAPPLPLM